MPPDEARDDGLYLAKAVLHAALATCGDRRAPGWERQQKLACERLYLVFVRG
jgi:hypothetical protein